MAPVEAVQMTDYLLYEEVLGAERNRDIYRLALGKRELFAHSRTAPRRLYPNWRKSTVVYDRDFADHAAMIEAALQRRLARALQSLGVPAFEPSGFEVQLTSHNDGEYYHWHTDNGSRDTESRVLTFVYYFHAEPKRFSGGELVIYSPRGRAAVIEPRNDSMVLFDSSLRHEVKPVVCSSRRFEDGRFTINGWVRRKSAAHDDYFDAKVLSPPLARRARPAPVRVPAPQRAQTASGARLHTPDAGAFALAWLDLQSRLFHLSPQSTAIAVHGALSNAEFCERYYFPNRPVVLKGAMKDSPAVRRWTPSFFARHYGSVPVTVTAGRNSDPEYESNFEETLHTTTLGDFVSRLEHEPESNDYYLVARNYFFEHPALRPLRADLLPPVELIDGEDPRPGSTKLWLGPKGTVTPLHYDEHSIMFAQVFGRKRFKLIPPFDGPRLYVHRRFYSAVDPEQPDLGRHPEFAKASVAEVVLDPGDMLFLPVGWWHWVRALDVSISATFSSFRVAGGNHVLRTPQ